jgi:hypothetical protein
MPTTAPDSSSLPPLDPEAHIPSAIRASDRIAALAIAVLHPRAREHQVSATLAHFAALTQGVSSWNGATWSRGTWLRQDIETFWDARAATLGLPTEILEDIAQVAVKADDRAVFHPLAFLLLLATDLPAARRVIALLHQDQHVWEAISLAQVLSAALGVAIDHRQLLQHWEEMPDAQAQP